MTTSKKNVPHFERSNYDTAKIIYKRTFGYIATENDEREIRFCREIFRSKHVTHSQTKQMPPLQKF